MTTEQTTFESHLDISDLPAKDQERCHDILRQGKISELQGKASLNMLKDTMSVMRMRAEIISDIDKSISENPDDKEKVEALNAMKKVHMEGSAMLNKTIMDGYKAQLEMMSMLSASRFSRGRYGKSEASEDELKDSSRHARRNTTLGAFVQPDQRPQQRSNNRQQSGNRQQPNLDDPNDFPALGKK